jgi:hypothetical protein
MRGKIEVKGEQIHAELLIGHSERYCVPVLQFAVLKQSDYITNSNDRHLLRIIDDFLDGYHATSCSSPELATLGIYLRGSNTRSNYAIRKKYYDDEEEETLYDLSVYRCLLVRINRCVNLLMRVETK